MRQPALRLAALLLLALCAGPGCCTMIGQAALQPVRLVYGTPERAWVVPDGAGGERLLVRVSEGPRVMQCVPMALPLATFPAGQPASVLTYRLPVAPGDDPLEIESVASAEGFAPPAGARALATVTATTREALPDESRLVDALVVTSLGAPERFVVRRGVEHRLALEDAAPHVGAHLAQAAILPVTLALDAPLLPIYVPAILVGAVVRLVEGP